MGRTIPHLERSNNPLSSSSLHSAPHLLARLHAVCICLHEALPRHAPKTALVTTSEILFLNPATLTAFDALSLIDYFLLFETLPLIFVTSSSGCFFLVFSGSFLPFMLESFTGESSDPFCVHHSVTSSHNSLCAGDTEVYISSLSLSLPIRPIYQMLCVTTWMSSKHLKFLMSWTRLVIFIFSTIFPPASYKLPHLVHSYFLPSCSGPKSL